MYEITTIFPTSFMRASINRELSSDEIERVAYHKKHSYPNGPNLVSNDNHILNSEFPEIRKFIEDAVNHYAFNIMRIGDDVKFHITQSWLNFVEPGNPHHAHQHPNSIFSGVFYFNATEEHDSLVFIDHIPYSTILFTKKDWNIYNCESIATPVKTGDLLLFPSNTHHTVDPTTGDYTRISLAFNTFITGSIGGKTELTQLML
jgi:uncharacterized protein (TIGR02466 family)